MVSRVAYSSIVSRQLRDSLLYLMPSCYYLSCWIACSGGDADEIEEEYHQLAGGNSSQIDSPIQSNNHSGLHGPSAIAANTNIDSSIQVGLEMQQNRIRPAFPPSEGVVHPPPPTMAASNVAYTNPTTAVVLTAEQRAMIETKRQEALRRRQLRMQQQATAATTTTTISAPSNPYAK